MGRDLSIAVEVYNGEKWSTLAVPENGEPLGAIFNRDTEYAKILAKVRAEFESRLDEGETLDEGDDADIEGEALGDLTTRITQSVGRDYDLFDYIADAGWTDGRNKALSGVRGRAVDSSVPQDLFGYAAWSFLTVSELRKIDFKARIDNERTIPLEAYNEFIHDDEKPRCNTRGTKLVVSEDQYIHADKAAQKQMLKNNLYIHVDRKKYLRDIDDFLAIVQQANGYTTQNGLTGNDVRLVLIFSY